MKHKIQHMCFPAGLLLAELLTGCTLVKTTYSDAPIASTKFASPPAAQTFYNALLAEYFPVSSNQGEKYGAILDVPFPIWYEHKYYNSYRSIVNEALEQADANHDSMITEAEAKDYADNLAAKPPSEANKK